MKRVVSFRLRFEEMSDGGGAGSVVGGAAGLRFIRVSVLVVNDSLSREAQGASTALG